MKKTFFTIFLLSGFLYSATDKEILEYYKHRLNNEYNTNNTKLSIVSRQKISNSGFEKVIVRIEAKGSSVEDIIFTKDKILTPDLINAQNFKSLRADFFKQKQDKVSSEFKRKALNLLKDEKMFISIGDEKKPTMYVFSDPECPYCRRHLRTIEEDLKTYRIKFILTPVHPDSAFDKAYLIYKESKEAKNDDEKLKIMRKYYSEDIDIYPEVLDSQRQEIVKLFDKYFKLGLRGVPTIIKEWWLWIIHKMLKHL